MSYAAVETEEGWAVTDPEGKRVWTAAKVDQLATPEGGWKQVWRAQAERIAEALNDDHGAPEWHKDRAAQMRVALGTAAGDG